MLWGCITTYFYKIQQPCRGKNSKWKDDFSHIPGKSRIIFSHVKKNICLDCLTKTRSKLIQVKTPLFTILNTKGVRKLKCVMQFRKKNVTHLYSSFFLCLTKTFTSLKIKEYFLGHKALVPPCRHRVLHVFMHCWVMNFCQRWYSH